MVQTHNCRTPDCDGIAQATRGRYAYLCGVCIEAAKLTDKRKTREAPSTSSSNGSGSFEQRAKALVSVGRTIDRKRLSYVKARDALRTPAEELKEAMQEWARLCRELGGVGGET